MRRSPIVELGNGKAPAGTVSVSAGDLPLQQRCIAGTTAHAISMTRRNAVEGVNENLKRNFPNVDRGYVRMFGTMAIALMFAFTLAGLNVYLARSFRRLQKAERDRAAGPRRRKARRTRTFDEVLGTAFGPSNASDAEDAAGRAPP